MDFVVEDITGLSTKRSAKVGRLEELDLDSSGTGRIFTTGEIAKLLKMAPRTISKFIDSGRLRGYLIPGSNDRRVTRQSLLRFLTAYGIPAGELERPIPADPKILEAFMSDPLTTGDVAIVLDVAPRTVSKLFDSGILRGFRIPGSQDRRIPRAEFLNFCAENALPLDELVQGSEARLLVAGDSALLARLLHRVQNQIKIERFKLPEDLERLSQQLLMTLPKALLLDLSKEALEESAIKALHSKSPSTRLIGITPRGQYAPGLFDETFEPNMDSELVYFRIQPLIGITA